MRRMLAGWLALSLTWSPAAAAAQQAPQPPASQAAAEPQPSPASGPSVEALGLSFTRIKRELGERPPSKNKTPLKLEFYVEVMGIAPAIQLFTPEELAPGPVSGGPPTHWEMVNTLWTKPEFRAPAVPISSLAIWGISKIVKYEVEQAKKRKAEAERRLRDEELKRKYPDIVVK